jgi:hypothetical protein
MSGIKGRVAITGCVFDGPHDDPINIHGTGNRFDGMSMASIYISADASEWYESGRSPT